MASKNFLPFFSCIIFTIIAVTSATANDIAPPRLAPLMAPQAATVDCMTLIYDMADCISFLAVGSKDTKPEAQCCSGFVTVLKTDADCVCEALKSSAQLGFDIDIGRAAALPSACNTKAPSSLSCMMSEAPGASPVATPVNSPSMEPALISPISPAPVPVSSKSYAPVPQASPITSPKSPAWNPTTPITLAPITPHQGLTHFAPAPVPSGAYALVHSYTVHFGMMVASLFFVFA